jgi:hypothetical protein
MADVKSERTSARQIDHRRVDTRVEQHLQRPAAYGDGDRQLMLRKIEGDLERRRSRWCSRAAEQQRARQHKPSAHDFLRSVYGAPRRLTKTIASASD